MVPGSLRRHGDTAVRSLAALRGALACSASSCLHCLDTRLAVHLHGTQPRHLGCPWCRWDAGDLVLSSTTSTHVYQPSPSPSPSPESPLSPHLPLSTTARHASLNSRSSTAYLSHAPSIKKAQPDPAHPGNSIPSSPFRPITKSTLFFSSLSARPLPQRRASPTRSPSGPSQSGLAELTSTRTHSAPASRISHLFFLGTHFCALIMNIARLCLGSVFTRVC